MEKKKRNWKIKSKEKIIIDTNWKNNQKEIKYEENIKEKKTNNFEYIMKNIKKIINDYENYWDICLGKHKAKKCNYGLCNKCEKCGLVHIWFVCVLNIFKKNSILL